MTKSRTLIALALFEHALERAELRGQRRLDAQLQGVDLARSLGERVAEAPNQLFLGKRF